MYPSELSELHIRRIPGGSPIVRVGTMICAAHSGIDAFEIFRYVHSGMFLAILNISPYLHDKNCVR